MGAFRNPVVSGFFPDPSVCRVGQDYYLATSSFEYVPGVPILHSRDLVHWRQIGNALGEEQLGFGPRVPASGGVYAPTLRHHDGLFWLITTNLSGGGTVIVTATDPGGPWSDPVRVPGITGIDPDLAWDAEGNCWCTFAGIKQARIDPKTGETLETPRRVWSGTPGAQYPEAPHLYRIGEWWYLLIAEGGTERGHGVSIARGPRPDGPFTPCPANPILTHRSTDRPIQNTGHGDLIQAHDGTWWLLFLGVRPRGGSPGYHVLGRETFLAPVTWVDGWPVIGDVAPVTEGPTLPAAPWPDSGGEEHDDFRGPRLHPRWIQPRVATARLDVREGWLTVPEGGFAGRRQTHLSCRVQTRADAEPGAAGGLMVRLDERHWYGVHVDGDQVIAEARIGPLRQVVGIHRRPPGPVLLTVAIDAAGPDPDSPTDSPDLVRLGLVADDEFVSLAELDGRYLSTEVAGGFTGRVIGLSAFRGTVHFDWFSYTGSDA
nr:glycoside hydrolase family 43 protein [Catenuloplanes niger]